MTTSELYNYYIKHGALPKVKQETKREAEYNSTFTIPREAEEFIVEHLGTTLGFHKCLTLMDIHLGRDVVIKYLNNIDISFTKRYSYYISKFKRAIEEGYTPELVLTSFLWERTNEGYYYWDNIHNKLYEGIINDNYRII